MSKTTTNVIVIASTIALGLLTYDAAKAALCVIGNLLPKVGEEKKP